MLLILAAIVFAGIVSALAQGRIDRDAAVAGLVFAAVLLAGGLLPARRGSSADGGHGLDDGGDGGGDGGGD